MKGADGIEAAPTIDTGGRVDRLPRLGEEGEDEEDEDEDEVEADTLSLFRESPAARVTEVGLATLPPE